MRRRIKKSIDLTYSYQKPWIFLLSLLLISYCSMVSAQNTGGRQINRPVQKKNLKSAEKGISPRVEKRSSSKDFWAIPVGGIVGFGLGHSLQNRYDSGGRLYTILDGITFVAIPLFVMGDCAPNDSSCDENKGRNSAILMVAFWGSRVAQAIDLSLFYSRRTYADNQIKPKNNNAQLFFTPVKNGSLQVNLAWSF